MNQSQSFPFRNPARKLIFENQHMPKFGFPMPPPPPLLRAQKKNFQIVNLESLSTPSLEKEEEKNEINDLVNVLLQPNLDSTPEVDPKIRDTVIMYSRIESQKKELLESFQKTHKLKIDQIFNERFAESLYQYIIRIPDSKLNIACGIRNTKYEKKMIPTLQKRNQDNINEANKTFGKGEFSYVFQRGMNNTPGEISQYESMLRLILNSDEFKKMLSEITGLEITQLNTMFLSKYKSGHFLSPHSDKGNGKIAFVMNLTKGWQPQYGGNLHFLSEDRTKIVETWTPAFNNMVVFFVPPDKEEFFGLPHFVGHVAPGLKISRYAITGWYS
jgi:Rps23 Pro-64 3,4-dihydroxylase Tpa1-like proline 4-hydroxylase